MLDEMLHKSWDIFHAKIWEFPFDRTQTFENDIFSYYLNIAIKPIPGCFQNAQIIVFYKLIH